MLDPGSIIWPWHLG